MKAANKEFLDAQRFHYISMKASGVLRGIDHYTRQEMVRVMGEEFQPGYSNPGDCPPCVFEMVDRLYRQYDAWITAQPIIIQEDPIKVIANFPSNKSKHDKQRSVPRQ